MRALLLAIGALGLAACNQGGTGYVELKTVPVTARAPALYLDADKLETKSGTTLLRQPVGTTKLQIEGGEGRVMICQVVVRKNRITTVTVSSLDRPPRCQCERTGTDSKACIG